MTASRSWRGSSPRTTSSSTSIAIDRLIVGSPQDCIEQIQKYRDAIDLDYLILSFRVASGPSHEEELECLRRFGAEVIPAFKETPAASAAS